MSFQARYYDGKQAEPYSAMVVPEADGLLIQTPTLPTPLFWDYASVMISEIPEYIRPLIVTNSGIPDARLVIYDYTLYDSLVKKIPKGNAPRITISTSATSISFWFIAAATVTYAVYWLAPQLALPIAEHFPASWEQRLGDYTVAAIVADKTVCKNSAGVAALDKLVNSLSEVADLPMQVSTLVVKSKSINAFSAPGGRIVIYNHLIETADNTNELAGVIAHEMGHIIKRHPTQSMVRALGLDLVIKMVFGGTDKTATTASIGNSLFQLRYNRMFEREADEMATQILYNANIDNRGFIKFFMRLQAEQKFAATENILTYASTHPPTSERIEAIQKAKNVTYSAQILTAEEWQSLKTICN